MPWAPLLRNYKRVIAVLLSTNAYGWMNEIDFTVKAFCFATSQRLRGLLFFFASPKKKQKRSPPNDNTPFVGGTLVELLYYCKLEICSLMLNENSHCFLFQRLKVSFLHECKANSDLIIITRDKPTTKLKAGPPKKLR